MRARRRAPTGRARARNRGRRGGRPPSSPRGRSSFRGSRRHRWAGRPTSPRPGRDPAGRSRRRRLRVSDPARAAGATGQRRAGTAARAAGCPAAGFRPARWGRRRRRFSIPLSVSSHALPGGFRFEAGARRRRARVGLAANRVKRGLKRRAAGRSIAATSMDAMRTLLLALSCSSAAAHRRRLTASAWPDVQPFSANAAGADLPRGWQPWIINRAKAPTVYQLVEDAGTRQVVLRAVAEQSASGLKQRLDVTPAERPLIAWRWRVVDLITERRQPGPLLGGRAGSHDAVLRRRQGERFPRGSRC